MSERYNQPLPLTEGDLAVLEWYAAWTPAIHAKVEYRRQWPPGFRAMRDCGVYGPHLQEAMDDESHPPALSDKERNNTQGKRSLANSRLHVLLAYRLIEGTTARPCRLTARGRAALKAAGRPCPDFFESHAPNVWDDHDLRPIKGINARLEMNDEILKRLPEAYRVKHGEHLPDDEKTWELMLAEYHDDDFRSRGTLTGATAHLYQGVNARRTLNGSLREHRTVLGLTVEDEDGKEVVDLTFSLEQFADMITSMSRVPVTIDAYTGTDGMVRGLPAPPLVSITRRMKERIARSNQGLQQRVEKLRGEITGTRMGKTAQAKMLRDLDLLAAGLENHGAFAATQAKEEVSQVAESMITVMRDQAEIAGLDGTALLLGGRAPGGQRLIGDGGAGSYDFFQWGERIFTFVKIRTGCPACGRDMEPGEEAVWFRKAPAKDGKLFHWECVPEELRPNRPKKIP